MHPLRGVSLSLGGLIATSHLRTFSEIKLWTNTTSLHVIHLMVLIALWCLVNSKHCLLVIKNLQNIFLSSIFTSTVEEDESAMPKKDSRLLLAKFNDQMEKLYELLRAVEDIRLAPEVRRQYTHL